LGARVAAGPGSPPKTLMLTELIKLFTESDLVGIDFWWHCGYKIDYYKCMALNDNYKLILF